MTMTMSTTRRRQVHGLPAVLTSFVGRRREMAEVKRLLSESRMVTLTGVGGVGKTRLALRVALDVQRAFPDGVWLVELAELANPELLAQTVVEALDVREVSSRPSLDVLLDHLRDKQALVVLDNCEHLLSECAVIADSLLRGAPDVRILATSRQALGIWGEQSLPVPTLTLPDSGAGRLPVKSLAQVESVRLFAERAGAALPGFAVTESNRDAVERICRRLDGIPLGIELAAVRLRALSVQQLLDRLDDRFRLLRAGSQVVLPRHQTLRAMIDWSYDLCTEQERLLWMRASVFSGGLDLEAAESVCAGEGIAEHEVIDLITELVDKSILVREEYPSGMRYRLLETVRQYGADRLRESGAGQNLRRRHRDYYRRLATEARADLFSSNQVALLTLLKLEHGNLRSAMDYCFAEPAESRVGLEMVANLLYHWLTGYLNEGHRRLDQGLAADAEPTEERARALLVKSWLSIIRGETEHIPAMLEESRAIGERLGDPTTLAFVTLYSGLAAMDQGDAETAIPLIEEAADAHRDLGNMQGLGLAYMWLCSARAYAGDIGGAIADGEEGRRLSDDLGETLHRSYIGMFLGVAFLLRGDIGRALELAKESLRVGRLLDNPRLITINLSLLAWIADRDGQHERAARLLGVLRSYLQSSHARGAIGAPVSGYRHLMRYHNRCHANVREALGDAAFVDAVERGAALGTDSAIAYALEERAAEAEMTGQPSPLTVRETEVAHLVAQGMTNKEIASSLVIAQRTAEGHIEHILNKLGFNSRSQIAAWVSETDPSR
jgi:predicted ATPase/DNA-binding NarL/FixJ family response regulator